MKLRILFSFLVWLCCGTATAASDFLWSRGVVSAEYLFLKPSVDDPYFVISGVANGDNVPNGKKIKNDFGFHSGWRLRGRYHFCDSCFSFDGSYLQLNAQDRKTVQGSALWGTSGPPFLLNTVQNEPGTASSENTLFYQRVDTLFSQSVNLSSFAFTFFEGVELAHLSLQQKTDFALVAVAGEVNNRSRVWGVGPQFGVEGEYELFWSACGVTRLKGVATGSLLVASSKQNVKVTQSSVSWSVQDEAVWRMIPAVHARLGVDYTTCICRMPAAIEIGCQFDFYHKALGKEVFTDSTARGAAFVDYLDVSLQGFYASLSIGF